MGSSSQDCVYNNYNYKYETHAQQGLDDDDTEEMKPLTWTRSLNIILHRNSTEQPWVTKKSDLSDFYFNLSKNVAFGGNVADLERPMNQETRETNYDTPEMEGLPAAEAPADSAREESSNQAESSRGSQNNLESSDAKQVPTETEKQDNVGTEQQSTDQSMQARHKRSEDALTAAKERYLARKRAKEQEL